MSSAVPLTQAVTSGDAKAVSAAIADGADVNERNNGGQTALILAVIFGHTHLAELLVKAGANPRLRDNLGLDAVEWAQRRGLSTDLFEIRGEEPRTTEPQTDSDEKSRKWLAGVKQRIQEQSAQKQPPVVQTQPAVQTHPTVQTQPVVQAQPAPHPAPAPEPEPVLPEPDPVAAAPVKSSTRKRCPKCNAMYNGELVAYCAHHVVKLVDASDTMFEALPSTSSNNSITSSPLLWILILATVSIAAFTAYMISSQLSTVIIPDSAASTPQKPKSFLKGTPAAAGDLAGKALTLADAECPVFEGDTRPKTHAATVNVHVKLDKNGKVYWARADGGDEALRNAATDAASRSSFSADKLRGRESEGTITYTFAQ